MIFILIGSSHDLMIRTICHALKQLTIPDRPIPRTSAPSLFRTRISKINIIPPTSSTSIVLLILALLVTIPLISTDTKLTKLVATPTLGGILDGSVDVVPFSAFVLTPFDAAFLVGGDVPGEDAHVSTGIVYVAFSFWVCVWATALVA